MTFKECLIIGHRVGFAMDSAGAVHDALAKYATATERKSEWFWVPADVRKALETLDLHAVGVTAERLEAVLAGLEAAR